MTFHGGEPLTSADVVWSLEALSAEDGAGAEDLAAITSIAAPDDLTVEVTLAQPDNDLLFNLTRRAGAVLQADATGLENTANGTGPFVFEEWNAGSSITLGVNDDYWGEVPSIAGVTFLYFTDPNAAVNAFTTGDVDILTGRQQRPRRTAAGQPRLRRQRGHDERRVHARVQQLARAVLQPRRPQWRSARRSTRRASRSCYNGFGTIIGGPVPPTDPWYEDLTDIAPVRPRCVAPAARRRRLRRRARPRVRVPEHLPDDDGRVRGVAARRRRDQRRDPDRRVLRVARAGVHQRRLRHDGGAARRAARHRQLRQPRLLLAATTAPRSSS